LGPIGSWVKFWWLIRWPKVRERKFPKTQYWPNWRPNWIWRIFGEGFGGKKFII